MPAPEGYDAGQKLLHWLSGLLALAVLVGGFRTGDLEGFAKSLAAGSHAAGGLVLWALMAIRLLARFAHPVEPPPTLPSWQVHASLWLHRLLYALLLLQPLVGLAMAIAAPYPVVVMGLPLAGAVDEPSTIFLVLRGLHRAIARLFALAVVIHVAATIVHTIRRDGVMSRMLPAGRRRRE